MGILIGNLSSVPSTKLEDYRCLIDKELSKRKKEHFENLYSSFDVIIENASKNGDYHYEMCYSGSHSFFLSKRTVQINPGRQTGKTCYIASRIDPSTDIVITPSFNLQNEFIKLLLGHKRDLNTGKILISELRDDSIPFSFTQNFVFNISIFKNRNMAIQAITPLRGRRIRRVWFDEFGLLSNNDNVMSTIYDVITPLASKDIVFIKMGE
jgi:hypothetical protein